MFSFLNRLVSGLKPVRQHSRSRKLTKQCIQRLEVRTLPAVLTVGTLQDVVSSSDGVLSLREAVTQANSTTASDEIQFAAGLGGGQLNLTQGALVISKNLAIEGLTNKITIDASGLSRIFTVNSSISLSVDNLILQDGRTSSGGAIYVYSLGNLTLENSIVRQNVATSSGGAIYGASQASYVITNTTFSDNTATSNGGALRLDASGTATITNSSFIQNFADSDNSNAGDGGAIYSRGVLAISGSTFTGNEGRSGGAIYASSGNTTTLTSSTVSDNFASYRGGAIYATSANVTVDQTTLSNNSAVNDGGAIRASGGTLTSTGSTFTGNSGARGGALYLYTGTVNISGSNFVSNQSAPGIDGGAIFADRVANVFSILNTTFHSNISGDDGGGLFMSSLTVSLQDCLFQNNIASDDGGAFYVKPSVSGTVTNTQFVGNRADDTGGAIFVRESSLQFIGSTFTGNTALHLYGTGSASDGATGYLSYDSSAIAHATATFTTSTIDGQLVGTPTAVTLSTSLTQTQRNAIFAQYPILAQWL